MRSGVCRHWLGRGFCVSGVVVKSGFGVSLGVFFFAFSSLLLLLLVYFYFCFYFFFIGYFRGIGSGNDCVYGDNGVMTLSMNLLSPPPSFSSFMW